VNELDIIKQFEDAMIAAGLRPVFRPGERIEIGQTADGRPQRFHVDGDGKGSRNGWYVLFADGMPAGEFGSWKTGESHTWCGKRPEEITNEQREEMDKRIEAARKERERHQRKREGEAAKNSNLLWNQALPVLGDAHPYLKRKGIVSHQLRTVAWPVRNREGEVFRTIENTLVIPIYNASGAIVSLQGIFPSADAAFGRDKDFMIGGKKKGCFFLIGKPEPGRPVAICEGYATGESIHQATGWCVGVAWDAYNVPHVAKALRGLLPDHEFVICADNDRWTTKPVNNPGKEYAERAGQLIGARVVVVDFADLDDHPTDFNDLHMREGIEAVQSQILPKLIAAREVSPDASKSTGMQVATGDYYVSRNLFDFVKTDFPDRDGKGTPKATALNLAELCRRTGIIIRYNVIKKCIEILVPGLQSSIDNEKEVSLSELQDCMRRCNMPTGSTESALARLAENRSYNPVATWIDSKEWDGVSRLQDFFDTVEEQSPTILPDGRVLKDVMMRKWLISAVAAAYEPNGVVARGVLTFVSKQNLGKTRWAKQLAPRELGVIADGEVLNPSDRDSVKRVVSKWIVELGEVDATFRKADIAALKGFISRDSDELRRPYARAESNYARRTIFFASVNDERFLHDATGNTRWWTVHAVALGEPSKLDMQQVWAEVKTLYDAKESWHLTRDELEALNAHNSQYEALSPVAEMIDRNFDWSLNRTLWKHPFRATEIAMAANIDRPTKKDINEAAAYVVKRYDVMTTRIGKDRNKAWLMPPRIKNGEAAPL
jgi:putative DNA primase/helicase